MSESVGKKIVEALKLQNDTEHEEEAAINSPDNSGTETFNPNNDQDAFSQNEKLSASNFSTPSMAIDDIFMHNLNQNIGNSYQIASSDIELPSNVEVLTRLINKLPTGVPKQTGALIIRQTMEALGISMDSVLQETKQVKENLTNNALECQKNILDYRKQITMLELKAQQYQKQALVMNDIINLFVQSSFKG